MAVISVSIEESVQQIVFGIPKSVTITTNSLASIFYTLDGSEPTIYSNIYTSTIELPTNYLTLTLKVFATDGTDSSVIVTNIYKIDNTDQNVRLPHSGTTTQPNSAQSLMNPAPFGSPSSSSNQKFIAIAESGYNINDELLPQIPLGYDSDGYGTAITNGQNLGIPSKDFLSIYSETDSIGQQGPGIGTLPNISKINYESGPPLQSNIGSRFFDPRALVIIQDLTKNQDPNIPPHINKGSFTLTNVQKASDGNHYYNHGLDAPPTSGSFVRQHYNPAKNTMTYYYYDSSSNRWIISTVPFTPNNDQYNYASKMVLRRKEDGAGKVFVPILWKASYLY